MNDYGLVRLRQEEIRQAARRSRRPVSPAEPWWVRSARRLTAGLRRRPAQAWTPTLRSVR
jgi:hypothetical protein